MHSTSFRTSRPETSTIPLPRTCDLPKEAVSPLPSFGTVMNEDLSPFMCLEPPLPRHHT